MIRAFVSLIFVLSLLSCDAQERQMTKRNPTAGEPYIYALTMPLCMHDASAEHQAAIRFSELVEKRTKGQMTIEVIRQETKCAEREIIADVQKGIIDFAVIPSARLTYIAPDLQLFDLPFFFEDTDAVNRVYDSAAGKLLLSKLDIQNLVGLAFWHGGFKQLVSSTPITTPSDLGNQRFKVFESSLLREQFSNWGAHSLSIGAGQTKMAYEKGAIDGEENTPRNVLQRLPETPHITLTNHGYLSHVMLMSLKTFDSIPEKFQSVINKAAIEATSYQHQLAEQKNQEALFLLKNTATVTVTEASPTFVAWLKEHSSKLLEFYRMRLGTEMVEQVLQAKENWQAPHPDKLLVALDADMSGNSALSGLAIRRGIEIAIEEINQSGGLLGKEVALIARDNSMIPSRGLDNLEIFAGLPNLLAVFSGISSPVVLAELDYLHQNKTLMLVPWAAATPIVSNEHSPNYVFRVSVRDEYAADFLLDGALDVSENVGFLLVNNSWGRSNFRGLTDSMARRNLTVSHVEWFDWGERNFRAKIDALVKKGVKVIIFVGNPVEGGKFVKALAKLDAPPVVISHWGITGSNFAEKSRQALEKIDLRVLQTFSFINADTPAADKLITRYHDRYNTTHRKEIVAPSGTAHAYDLMHMLAIATKKAGKPNMPLIQQELRKIEQYQGVMKDYQRPFSGKHQDALDRSDYMFATYQDTALYPLKE
ncbi:DctP family TRAP transporter solute-binding subunit [Enterovibrio sp. ZSDZ35]|uniref:DctP family TRAP transporter solute-binding subunit n=1 Tax=Enterovibrio qingdaonensis TaxID=2899818 RepID=A0ABT5QSZ8_9GAMM|nr:DctP family TRAP transporter solute-binding subunit [Enterovibrio sp. ZSDZ35]MDD1784103.1 DctP family TRAP transporter solute-binding subunit [Enterovibrio sp. ZSDZ35]